MNEGTLVGLGRQQLIEMIRSLWEEQSRLRGVIQGHETDLVNCRDQIRSLEEDLKRHRVSLAFSAREALLGVKPDGSPSEASIIIRSLLDELKEIDDALFESIHGDVEHQIECHADTLSQYTRHLAETIRKIDRAGHDRRERVMDEVEARAAESAELRPEHSTEAPPTLEEGAGTGSSERP